MISVELNFLTRFIPDDPLLKPNSPAFSNGVFAEREEAKAVDGNTTTFTYTHSNENAFLAFDFGKFYALDRIEVDVYGSESKDFE